MAQAAIRDLENQLAEARAVVQETERHIIYVQENFEECDREFAMRYSQWVCPLD